MSDKSLQPTPKERFGFKEHKRGEHAPLYDQACRDYYLDRLNGVIEAMNGLSPNDRNA